MEQQLLTVELPSGAVLRVCTAEMGSGPKDVERTRRAELMSFMPSIAEFATLVSTTLQEIQPDKLELEFSVGLDVSTGKALAWIVDSKANAAFKVTVGWNSRSSGDSDDT